MPHIVLLEDNIQYAFRLRMILEQSGYDVSWCKDANAALELIEAIDVDLLLTDVYITKEDGKSVTDAATHILGMQRISHSRCDQQRLAMVPIIVISAAVNRPGATNILEIAKLLGARKAFSKTIDEIKLLEAIAEICPLQSTA